MYGTFSKRNFTKKYERLRTSIEQYKKRIIIAPSNPDLCVNINFEIFSHSILQLGQVFADV